jgi:aspartate racemase
MAKHIGIVACSAEGAALCYRTICGESPEHMGEHAHPEITMHTHPLSEYMVGIRASDWQAVADLMVSSAEKVAACGADFVVCPDNTIHQALHLVLDRSPVSWLHIAEAVRDEAWRTGFVHLGLLGTEYLMEGPVYPEVLEGSGVHCDVPDEDDRKEVNRVIFTELVNGIFTQGSRIFFNEVIQRLKDKGCDAVVLGCTEIPLIVDPDDCPLPTLDSTRLLARAAIVHALK